MENNRNKKDRNNDEDYENNKVPLLFDQGNLKNNLPLMLAMSQFFGGGPWRGF